jgi:sugar/nucleoside kinase (ribokinase family)
MTITVIGHLCLDVIHPRSGNLEIQSYGGIYFSLAALAHLANAETTIFPVFGVGNNDYPPFIEKIRTLPNIDASGIFKFNGPTNRVHLYYHDDQQRTECSTHIAEPIPFKRIKPYLETDMVLINMVSGSDITLDTFDLIRMSVRERHTPVYFDVHSLSLGIKEDFTRYRRPVPDWRRWLFWLHAVQMNEEEAQGLTEEQFTERELVQQITALNTPAVVITRGESGCTVYKDERKHITRHDIGGVAVTKSLDTTGCGDVFGAAYCAHYLSTKNTLQSAGYANRVAAFNATTAGSTEIDRLARFKLAEVRDSLAQGVS